MALTTFTGPVRSLNGFIAGDGNTITDRRPVDAGRPVGTITMYDYDLNPVFAAGGSMAGGHMLVLPTNDEGHLGLHLLARKRS